MLPVYELKISEKLDDESEVEFVSLVDAPAIQRDYLVFNQEFVDPNKGEHEDEFIPRCIAYEINEGKDPDQAAAICYSKWENKFAGGVSFDFDGVLTTKNGVELLDAAVQRGTEVYIISARHDDLGLKDFAQKHGVKLSNVYATGSNKAKVEKIKELGLSKHYDNNADVISELGSIGEKFDFQFAESYNDYPKAASENAKIALRWAEENGWGDCGTPVGKIRANQLANGEAISRDTIARMSAFERHRQNSDKPLGEGCGRLMWLAWGGDEGIEWAKRKLEQIDREQNMQRQKFQIVSEDQKIISGPIMLAGEKIYRNNEQFGEHYVVFNAETIKKIAIKFSKKKYQSNVNLMHDTPVEGVTMFESFIVDKKRGIKPMAGFEDVQDGSWFGSFYVENQAVWEGIKRGEYKGFSVEGLFDYDVQKEEMTKEEQLLKKISDLLNVTITE